MHCRGQTFKTELKQQLKHSKIATDQKNLEFFEKMLKINNKLYGTALHF